MGADKDAADKAKADVERVEAEEDEAHAESGQQPAQSAHADRARKTSFDRPKSAR